MTNYKQAPNNKRRGHNIKDGHGPNRKPPSQAKQFEANGFIQTDWNKWSYTWQGVFPKFDLRPGAVDGFPGLVAFGKNDIAIRFDYGTPPYLIAARLNDEILAIMQHDADVDAPLKWQPPIDWIDIDAFMAVA